jgi:hypothetical protein
MQLPCAPKSVYSQCLANILVIHRLVVYSDRPRWNQAVLRQPAHTTSPDGMCETTGRYCGISRVARRRRRRCLDECSRPLRCDVRRHGVRGQSLSGPTAQATPGWSGQPSPGTKMGLRGGEQFCFGRVWCWCSWVGVFGTWVVSFGGRRRAADGVTARAIFGVPRGGRVGRCGECALAAAVSPGSTESALLTRPRMIEAAARGAPYPA